MRQKLAYFAAVGYTCLREDDAERVPGGLHPLGRRNDLSKKQKHVLFLCAHRSVRELVAASLLAAYEQEAWDIWIAPASFPLDEVALVRHVLDEVCVPLLSSPQISEPSFDRSWDEGIILCSGATNQ